ncbi:hypothetical protein CPB83DRAFT_789607 [Crepidotus variabilis]|uniref:Septation protein imp2 n=1 Tax=Crepidotus variabilis TaxID=179855 RepID=A0A9P6EIL2_9AGAR|nr:hypothetical protein CPB83DRAFT_789607 [Crepidotus variabilis]
MSARRQTSTTSLSKYARQNSPMMQNRSLDFCNSFWGLGDGGVDVLFARMRGASRTMEELKTFWKERASIEEDYAKRLAKLGKMVLGRDEIGELRASFDTIRSETERQASYHSNLAQQIRTELEAPSTAFHSRQLQHKKTFQSAIEKEFKTKQTQESYVNKAREKYEQDCIRINSFTAQASLVQGKDLEKINLKLERTQQTVQTNEREFSNFAKALNDTVQKWEQDWKGFCDSCQDMEEQRMEFMKDNLWAYANAVSTVCVADDESCEKIRVSLEQMEPEREMETFVRDYSTGNQIPDPPAFVNYQAPDAIPSSSARPSYRPANFIRASTRESPIRHSVLLGEEEPAVNAAGIGAGGGGPQPRDPRANSYGPEVADLNRRGTQRDSTNSRNQPAPYTNGVSGHHGPPNQYHPGPTAVSPTSASSHSHSSGLQRQSTSAQTPQQQQLQRVLQDPYAGPIDPTAETYIKVGGNAYKVDPTKDPQPSAPNSRVGGSASPGNARVGTESDPLMKQLEELKNAVSTGGSVRRNTLMKPKSGSTPDPKPTHSAHSSISNRQVTAPGSSLSPPGSAVPASTKRSPSPSRDYRNSADLVVGSHPSVSRPPSPNPPTAAFMVPRNPQAVDDASVQEVLSDYQQSLPGERKSISRSNSTRNSVSPAAGPSSQPPQQQQQHGQNLARPTSQMGHVGVGAHGGSRSNSPQPTISRGPSPQPGEVVRRGGFIQPPAQSGSGIARAPSPNAVGIALDPSGRVMHDELAQRYQQQPQPSPLQHNRAIPPQSQQPGYNPPGPPQQAQQAQRRSSYMAPPPGQPYASVTPPPQASYHQTPSPQPSHLSQQRPSAQQTVPTQYQPPSQQAVQPYQQPPPQQRYQPPPVQQQAPPPQMHQYGSMSSINGSHSQLPYYGNQTPPQQQNPPPMQAQAPPPQQQQMAGMQQRSIQQPIQQQPRGYQPPQQQQQLPPQQQQPQHLQQQYAEPGRSPSPQPPVQTMEDGAPVLFYVRALYDYTATIEEEFDFQAGDIIAVTSTPEDGWWTGELLDEARRQKGRNVFPSNFVCLF